MSFFKNVAAGKACAYSVQLGGGADERGGRSRRSLEGSQGD